MLTERAVKIIGYRVKLFRLAGSTAYLWDSNAGKFVRPGFYNFIVVATATNCGASLYVILMSIQLYLKLTYSEIPEDLDGQHNVEDTAVHKQLMEFATLMMQWAEIILICSLTFIQYELVIHGDTVIYLLNQLIDYNKRILKMLEERDIRMDADHKKSIRTCITFQMVVYVFTLFIPVGVVIALTHPIEPTHNLMLDWLDIDFGMNVESIPLILLMLQSTLQEANSIAILCFLINMYFFTAVTCVNDMTPEAVDIEEEKGRTSSHLLVTRFYGTLEDTEIIVMYRTQQLLNILMKEIFGHWTIAFHHVGILVTFSVLFCFAIKYNSVMADEGILAYMIVTACLISPMLLMYIQCHECGGVVDASEEFKNVCGRTLEMKPGRNTKIFRRFAKTCSLLYIPVAYPFYNVDKGTFLDFCDQSFDKSITLLLW